MDLKNNSQDNFDVSYYVEQNKLAMLKVLAWSDIILTSIIIFVRAYWIENFFQGIWLHLSILFGWTVLGLYLAFGGGVKWGGRIMVCIYVSLLPAHLFEIGGILSRVGFYFIGFSIFAYAIYGRKGGNLALGWAILSFVGFTLWGPPSPEPLPPFSTAIGKCFAFSIIVTPTLFIVRRYYVLGERAARVERQASENVVMRRILHEVGNALNITIGFIELWRGRKEPIYLEKAQKPLIEAQLLIHGLTRYGQGQDLVAFLKRHSKEIKIMNKIEDEIGR